MITFERVTMKFGSALALNNVNLHIGAHQSVALWGSNGAGKTTLIRCLLGLLAYDGRITVGGLDALRDGKRARKLIGYVPQELGFYDDLRVDEAIRFFARLKACPAFEVGATLRSVGLEGHQRKRVRELSGGMKQRLALGISMIGDPPVLVLDEVTASLDVGGRLEFLETLNSMAGSGKVLVFASHRLEEVEGLANRVVVLERGGAVLDGDVGAFRDWNTQCAMAVAAGKWYDAAVRRGVCS